MDRMVIGSDGYEQMVLDWGTRNYYDLMVPRDGADNLMNLAGTGRPLWKQEAEMDPWELLACAVICEAARDWCMYAMEDDTEGMESIAEWFRKNSYSQTVLDALEARWSRCRGYEDRQRLLDSIRIIR